ALKFQNLVAAGERPRHADRVHGPLSAAATKTDEVGGLQALADHPGELNLLLRTERPGHATLGLRLDGGGDARIRMAMHQGAVAIDEVEVLVAVDVAESSSGAVAHDDRIRVVDDQAARSAAWYVVSGVVKRLGRTRRPPAVFGLDRA